MTTLNGRSPTLLTTDIGREFVQLALGVASHIPDCLNAYWGPSDWLESVSVNSPSLTSLRAQAVDVATAIQQSILPKNRQQRLQFQTRALLWLIRARLGEKIIFSEQVRFLLDAQPESVNSTIFIQSQEALDVVLSQSGTLLDRWLAWQAAHTRPLADVFPQIQQAVTYLSQFWPKAAEFDLQLIDSGNKVHCQPYSIYLPANMLVRVDRLVHLAAKWTAMCGMITAVANRYQNGQTESAVWLNYGPQQLLVQGLPPSLLSAADPYEAIIPIILRALHIPAIPAQDLRNIHLAEDALRWVDANAALMRHGEGIRPRVLRRYLMEHKLVDRPTAEQRIEQLADPFQAANIFASLIGEPLIKAWLEKSKLTVDDLLKDPPVPSTMLFEVRFGD